jgi:ATP-dependent Lon protease
MQDQEKEPEDVIQIEAEENKVQAVENILPQHLTILPLAQRPVFPGMPVPIAFTGEDKIEALKKAVKQDNGYIGLVLAREIDENDYTDSDLYEVGTTFQILRLIPVAPNTMQVLGQGISRFERKKTILIKPHIRWEINHQQSGKSKPDQELKAYMLAISSEIKELLKINPLFQEQVNMVVSQLNYDAPSMTMDIISNLLTSSSQELQGLLETFDLHERAKMLLGLIRQDLEIARIQKRISNQIEEKVSAQQKEFFLREQLKAIKKELGIEKEDNESEADQLEERLSKLELTDEAEKVVNQELEKLRTLNAQSPEFNVTRNYLETIADLPWGKYTDDNHNIKKARKILDKEHFGLDEVKERILEFLSTIIRRGRVAGSIICLVGPPGVGKTSIGKSIAHALGRKFYRFSVGGMRDEAEIKGHRRTYIGAMPGKLIQALRRVEAANPVIMLDEIDKIGNSFRGDPASALLEVLDPEQNSTFVDHYLDLAFDLSNVLFVTTANQLDTIPGPLLDRMEIIRLAGYILDEKVQIAKQYLVPKQLEEAGFAPKEITFTDGALKKIVEDYAWEAGVRNLEKQIRRIIRKVNLQMAEDGQSSVRVGKEDIEKFLGKAVFNTEKLYDRDIPGVALGLAYTSYGGATLYIEATAIKSKGAGFKQTGQLGNVMKESAEIAYSYVRGILSEDPKYADFFDNHLIHLHVPAGATPKDGPSAGITMSLALYSLVTEKIVKDTLAMTGEITLTGKVLPIGGVKEKTIAARRVGIKELIFPIDNQKDFDELPEHIKKGLKVHYADYFEDVLKAAF